jgi:hypothetical protein
MSTKEERVNDRMKALADSISNMRINHTNYIRKGKARHSQSNQGGGNHMNANHTYTVEAGRQIYRDGKPWLYISGNQGHYQPVEADALVYLVVDVLNSGYVFNDSKGKPPFKWVKSNQST